MCQSLHCSIAVALSLTVVTAADAEENGKWELEQRGKSLFALSYGQSAFINNQTATSELAFLCDQKNKMGVSARYWFHSMGPLKVIRTRSPFQFKRNLVNLIDPTFSKSERMGRSSFFWRCRMTLPILQPC